MSPEEDLKRKAEYIKAVTRGEGFVPWQSREVPSPEENAFREKVERRKDRMLAGRVRVKHPGLLGKTEIEQTTTPTGGRQFLETRATSLPRPFRNGYGTPSVTTWSSWTTSRSPCAPASRDAPGFT